MITGARRSLPDAGLPPAVYEQSIPQRFAEVVKRNPEALALACDGQSLTYAQLDAASRGMAAALLSTDWATAGKSLPPRSTWASPRWSRCWR